MTHGVLRVLGSNPAPFHWQELPLVVPNPTPQHFVSRTHSFQYLSPHPLLKTLLQKVKPVSMATSR